MLCLLSTASDVYSTSCSEETLNGAWKQRERTRQAVQLSLLFAWSKIQVVSLLEAVTISVPGSGSLSNSIDLVRELSAHFLQTALLPTFLQNSFRLVEQFFTDHPHRSKFVECFRQTSVQVSSSV